MTRRLSQQLRILSIILCLHLLVYWLQRRRLHSMRLPWKSLEDYLCGMLKSERRIRHISHHRKCALSVRLVCLSFFLRRKFLRACLKVTASMTSCVSRCRSWAVKASVLPSLSLLIMSATIFIRAQRASLVASHGICLFQSVRNRSYNVRQCQWGLAAGKNKGMLQMGASPCVGMETTVACT